MTLKELIGRVAHRQGVSTALVEGFVLAAVEEVLSELHRGGVVKIRGIGTLRWKSLQPWKGRGFLTKDVPPGWKLCFTPAAQFRTRRREMSDNEGMTKYGVQLDDEKTKEASEGSDKKDRCPICQRELDDARACPVHGTEPLEPTGR